MCTTHVMCTNLSKNSTSIHNFNCSSIQIVKLAIRSTCNLFSFACFCTIRCLYMTSLWLNQMTFKTNRPLLLSTTVSQPRVSNPVTYSSPICCIAEQCDITAKNQHDGHEVYTRLRPRSLVRRVKPFLEIGFFTFGSIVWIFVCGTKGTIHIVMYWSGR